MNINEQNLLFGRFMHLKGLKAYVHGVNGLIQVMFLRFQEAEGCLSQGIRICPSLSYNYGLRAYVRLCQEDLVGAIEDCTSKIALSPRDAGTYALRGWANYLAGNYDLSILDLEKSIELDPSRRWYASDCLRLIDSYRQVNAPDKIISFCSQTIKPQLQPDLLVELLRARGNAFAQTFEFDKSLIDLNHAIGLASQATLMEIYIERSCVFEAKREHDLAERDRMAAAQLQSHKAQMSEWVPASPAQRMLAKLIDSFVVGCLSAFAIFLLVCVLDILRGGATSAVSVSQCIPFVITSFLLGFLDCMFVCLGPIVLAMSLILLVSHKDLALDMTLLTTPWSSPEHALMVASVAVLAVNFFYHTIMECSPRESTLGKAVVRLRIKDIDGCRLTFARSALRHFLAALPSSLVVVSLSVLAYMVLFSQDSFFIKSVFSLLAICILVLGLLACLNPGVHNVFSKCLITDNHLYAPRFDLISGGEPGIEGAGM